MASGLSTTKALSGPPTVVTSSAVTVMLAEAIEETANTVRATPACAATATSRVVVGGGRLSGAVLGNAWTNEAQPEPAGWFTIFSRNILSKLVRFCRTIGNARCSVALSGLEFCGASSARPSVIRAE